MLSPGVLSVRWAGVVPAGELFARPDRVEAQGAEVLQLPLIEFAPPETWEPLDQAIERLETYRWVIFTSTNGVEAFFLRLRALRQDAVASQVEVHLQEHVVQLVKPAPAEVAHLLLGALQPERHDPGFLQGRPNG